ncbi:MAG TPA: hypothetical protein VK700_02550 [Steroidobacteraceae bacterium]|jgi:hypothetical protein|nr:hypothetical protein [Steroidobacteraceae bacterium]
MALPETPDHPRRLRRTIVLGTLCVAASALGMLLARPLAASFHSVAPWILPALAVGVLAILVTLTLLVLPRLGKPRP